MSPVYRKQHRFHREKRTKDLITQQTLNIFALSEGPGIKTHPTGGARNTSHGINFEREMTMLWTYRAYRTGREYNIAIEDERTGKFDDYYLGIKLDDGTFLQQFMQLKHSNQELPKLTIRDLLPSEKKNIKGCKSYSKNFFDLRIYFKSFLDIKNCSEFNSIENSKEMFIIYTNRSLTFDGKLGEFEFCESMFEKVKDTVILNTVLFKFKDEFLGRDGLKKILSMNMNDQENTDKFLQNFYIAESQPAGKSVSEIIKSELSQEFKGVHCKNLYNQYYMDFSEWYKARDSNSGTKLSHEIIQGYFTKMKHQIVEQTSFDLMDPTPNFYGRKDVITKIRKHLIAIQNSTSNLIDVSLSGMSGVGKTEIARYYAKKYRSEYDYILWMNASSKQTLEDSFLRLSIFLNVSDKEQNENNKSDINRTEKDISQDRIRIIYSFLQNYHCLFIFDSEFDLFRQEIYSDTRHYLPLTKCSEHHIIVTTPMRNLPCNLEEQVDNFSQEETLGFLKQNLDSNLYSDDIELVTLGNILSNVLLALQIATSYINEENTRYRILDKSYTVNEFLVQYKKESDLVLSYQSENLANKSLITICEFSIQSIMNSTEKPRNFSLKLLYIIAHLQPDHISTKIFHRKKGNKDLMNAILILEKRSLITVSSGHISIHKLTQDILRAKIQRFSESMKNKKIIFVDKKGRRHSSDTKEMVANGNYNKEFVLLTGLEMFEKSFNTLAEDNEQILTRNIIVRHLIIFIPHCIENEYIVHLHLHFILCVITSVSQYDKCLECIDYLKYMLNNLKYYTSINERKIAKFLIKNVIAEKHRQIGDMHRGLEFALECQNISENYTIPFIFILQNSLLIIKLFMNVGRSEESFEHLMKLHERFNDFANVQKQKLSYDIIITACILGVCLQEHNKFEEALKLYETIYEQESYMCQNNLMPNKHNCKCVEIALSLSHLYTFYKKHFEAKEVLLSAQKCVKVPCNHIEKDIVCKFIDNLCYQFYHCGQVANAMSALDDISKIQFPNSIRVSDLTIGFKTFICNLTATYLQIEKKFEKAINVLLSELYGFLVICKTHNILDWQQEIEFGINDSFSTNIVITHNQAHPFKQLLYDAIYLQYLKCGFEPAYASLKKIENSVVEHFGHTTELNSYILMCELSLYKQEKKYELVKVTWIKILKLWYQLSKYSDSPFLMFRLTLGKFLDDQSLEMKIDSVFSKQLLATVEKAVNDVEAGLLIKHKIAASVLKFQYFQCLLLTKNYDRAEKYSLQLLSPKISMNIMFDVEIICDVHIKLALYFYNIKKETSEAIKTLNKCIHFLKNFSSDANYFSWRMDSDLNLPLKMSVTHVNEATITEFRTMQRVKCYIEKSKIYFDTGESFKGLYMLEDCMYKINDFDESNALFLPMIKEILLLLIKVGETDKAMRYINKKCKLDDDCNFNPLGSYELLRIKAKLQFNDGQKEFAVETLLKFWFRKLIVISEIFICNYQNIDKLDQIKLMLLKLENVLAVQMFRSCIINDKIKPNAEETKVHIETLFYIAICNYVFGTYNECIRALNSIDIFLQSRNEVNNEEIDNIKFDSSILKQLCNNCINRV